MITISLCFDPGNVVNEKAGEMKPWKGEEMALTLWLNEVSLLVSAQPRQSVWGFLGLGLMPIQITLVSRSIYLPRC